MDHKDVKTGLKEARDAIRDKDFKSALKHCKSVLKIDKNNYNALVFVGVCAQELDQLDQAVLAFRKAIEISPEQQLGWQGLAAFYEKHPTGNGKEMIEIYVKLAEFANDLKKKMEILTKLSKIYVSENLFDECVETLGKSRDISVGNEELELLSWKLTCEVLERFPLLQDEQMNLYESSLKGILDSTEDSLIKMKFGKEYVRKLQKMKLYEQAKGVVEKLEKLNSDNELCLEMLFMLFVESTFDGKYLDVDNIENICINCAEKNLAGSFANMALGAAKYRNKDFPLAKEYLIAGLNAVPSYIRGWILLCRTLRKMHNWAEIQQVSSRGLKILKKEEAHEDVSLQFKLQMYYLTSLLEINNSFDEHTLLCDSNPELHQDVEDIPELFYFQGYFYLKLNKEEDAIIALENLRRCGAHHWILGLEGLMNSHQGNLDAAKLKLTEALKYDSDNGILLSELGKILWSCGEHEEAKDLFLQAVKNDQWNYEAFLMLGQYYRDIVKNLTRAQQCYMKAFNLNEKDDIGIALSDLYARTDDEAANLKLLLQVTKNSATGSCKWAWIRLGLCYLKQNDTTRAIVAFQATLRADPSDGRCWECLADAYFQRGSFDAALKSFQRASEINAKSVYCMHQMASIRIVLGEYTEAIKCFKQVLQMSPSYLPALKGLAEAYLALVRKDMSQCLFGRAEEDCQEAINCITKALEVGNHISCLWKLLGDACLLMSSSGNRTLCLKVPIKLFQDQPKGLIGRIELLKIATMCFQKAATLLPSCSGYWHDLGLSLFYQANENPEDDLKRNLMKMATLSLKKATSLNPRNGEHWNTLGVIATSPVLKDYQLAQHCFIRAIQVESNNAVAWTNLGVLYLINGNEELAHRALSEAQSLEPSYANCWVSLAIIAEKVGHADTMDLFMHSTTLGNHRESLIGYGYWVCRTLHDVSNRGTDIFKYRIEEMAAIPLSIDCLTRYTDKYVTNSCAFNILGLLLEQQKLHKGASRAFIKSLELLETDAATNSKELDMVRENLARTYIQLQMYNEAVEHLTKIKEPRFFSQCSLATVLAKTNRLEDSYQAFESAVSWLTNTYEEKAHALISMAALAYPLEGAESAKTLLFQSTQQSTVCPQALLSLGAIGILSQDLTLATAAIDELSHWTNVKQFSRSIHLLKIGLSVMQDEVEKTKNIICKAIHINPNYGDLWALLAFTLLKISNEPNAAITQCAQVAITEKEFNLNAKILEGVATLASGNIRKAFITAQHVLHCYPDKVQSWCLMLAAMYGNYVFASNLTALKSLSRITSFIQTKFMMGKEGDGLKWWMGCYRTIVLWQTQQVEKADVAIRELGNFVNDPKRKRVYDVLQCIISSPINAEKLLQVSQIATKFDQNFILGWKVLVDSLLRDGNFEMSLDILKKWKATADLKPHNLVIPIIYEVFVYIKQAQVNPVNVYLLMGKAGKLLRSSILMKFPVTHYLNAMINTKISNLSKVKNSGIQFMQFPYRTELHEMFNHTCKLILASLNSENKDDVKIAHRINEIAKECGLHDVPELYVNFVNGIDSDVVDGISN